MTRHECPTCGGTSFDHQKLIEPNSEGSKSKLLRCSSCDYASILEGNFCPNCGEKYFSDDLPQYAPQLASASSQRERNSPFGKKIMLGITVATLLVAGILIGSSHSQPKAAPGRYVSSCRTIYLYNSDQQQCTTTWVQDARPSSKDEKTIDSKPVHFLPGPNLYPTPVQKPECRPGVKCPIGSIGPGGGIVFYDAGRVQPWGRYLEINNKGSADGWCDQVENESKFIGTSDEIGAGRKNTLLMLAKCGGSPSSNAGLAAQIDYPNVDWFLPSIGELLAMRNSSAWNIITELFGIANIASSSQDPSNLRTGWVLDPKLGYKKNVDDAHAQLDIPYVHAF